MFRTTDREKWKIRIETYHYISSAISKWLKGDVDSMLNIRILERTSI